MDIKEKLIKYWKNAWVDGVCYQFANAMQKLGFEKKDGRKKHQGKVYDAFNEFGGSRATCGAYADNDNSYGREIFQVLCRKRNGDYLIIAYNGKRVFECDYRGIIHYDEEQLLKCVEEYKPFFEGVL